MIIRRCEIGIVPFESIRHAEAELADDGRRVTAAVIVTGGFEVGSRGAADARVPFEVAVVVVGGEVVVGEVLMRVTGTPFRVLRFSKC